jgi:O-succinylbenzoic acid--CoA ligase
MTIEDFLAEWNSENGYITAHSSGSTGAPKPIRLPKKMVIASAMRTVKFFNLTSESHLHLPLDISYIAGKMMVVRSIVSGAKLTCEPASNKPLANNVDSQPIDLLAVVPSQLEYLLDNLASIPPIRNFLIGGSSIPTHLRQRIVESKVHAYESYGMTETASHVALRRVTEDSMSPFQMLDGLTCGKTEDSALVITMDDGSVIRTNDSVEIISPKEFIYKGRLDNVINSGGVKIHPEEVETEISRILTPDFWRSIRLQPLNYYISKRPSDKWGEEAVLLLETEGITSETKTRVYEALKRSLPPYHIPKDIIPLSHFPRTYNGKIIRN